ncbi:alkaline phosphatase family protein [Ancylobacter sp. MQZ15Z-1]|uniref:Alkaline phosphatase family protein n=1 Tax=Ancylobacter mangrovi TaxID=2972472 RepID=A0A9X2T0P5_9HYPH|nr:alkaline phosphatase family protein [Ancylobacter mangrovi]MCS0494090.1 alkaline phosphatase family protein [Ancylobacter mangrovi]
MIGLDGATFTLLDPLIQQGIMPFLGSILENGVRANLMSTRNPLTPPAWTSMVSGRRPEAHGIYDFLRPITMRDGGVFLKINDFRDNHCETLWSIVNRRGKRATSLNFYGMSPAPAIDGYVISGFVPWRHLRHGIHPKSLFDTVRSMDKFDYRDLGMDIGEEKKCVQGLHEGEHVEWIELQDRRDSAWAEMTSYILSTDPTDLTAVVLDGPDKVQHLFWRFVDPELVKKDGDAWYQQIRELCLGFYRKLDENIRKMVEAAGPDTDVILTSDHGFGPTTEIFYVNEWLSRNGYLTWSNTAADDALGQLTAEKIRDHLGMIQWQATTAFCPTPSSNAIYIKKDLGSGSGVKEEDYLDFAMKLQRELLEIRDPVNGEKIVLGADLNKLRGTSYVEPCPDITLRLRDGGFVSILKAREIIAQREEADGTHRPAGIFVGYGPSFRKGARVEDFSLLDIAPLILTLMGLPVPSDLDGQVPQAALADTREAVIGGATQAAGTSEDDREEPSEEEREALMKQLKILGYMD